MSRGSYNRTAVYTVTTAPDFHPQRTWSIPYEYTAAKLAVKNLPLHEAKHFARIFNKKQVALSQGGDWDHSWMIVASCCRPSRWHENGQPQAEEGVAT
jgi:hypothetical protein